MAIAPSSLVHPDRFAARHLGPDADEVRDMLKVVGFTSLDAFIDAVIPEDIRFRKPLNIPAARSEREALAALRAFAAKNQVFRSYIGMGYSDCITPPVVLRNVLENPGWYTAYTPYQAEIAQGRLEALLNYQTMVSDLTGLEVANASLLDEGTAAAEAVHLTAAATNHDGPGTYWIDSGCHPQTVAVVRTGCNCTRRSWCAGTIKAGSGSCWIWPTRRRCRPARWPNPGCTSRPT